ncbi:protein TBATA isoform X2 [Nelusetta ayraudi]|uniref:protein TBATA isoform X2 n=1 Tax=Nelusetta ayraudi TaxID=303726 RepID=UPI003F6E4D62
MSAAPGPDSHQPSGETSRDWNHHWTSSGDSSRKLVSGSGRFGSLSHHSFFSRHNPHPNRVRHIQGLNGRPVCSVRDDWNVTSSLFPHPLLRGHVHRKAAHPSFAFPPAHDPYRVGGDKSKSALFSEAWRDELKDLAARVNRSSQAQEKKQEENSEGGYAFRKTQYSAETGRLIPPSSKSYQRRSCASGLVPPQPFQDQELMVLEILCQILQTDSLSTIQQWLLLAGQREKDLVMGMIQRALSGVDLSSRHLQAARQVQASPGLNGPPVNLSWRKPKNLRISKEDKPEKIGEAEVLEIRTPHHSPDDSLQHLKDV